MGAESAIYSRLTATAAVTTLLATSTSVWPVAAPQGAVQPYIVYTVISGGVTPAMSANCDPSDALVDVSIVADSYGEVIALAAEVKTSLDRYAGTTGGTVVQQIFFTGEADVFDVDRKYFQKTLDFKVYYNA